MGKFEEVVLARKGDAGHRKKLREEIARACAIEADRDAPVGQRAQRIAPRKGIAAIEQPDRRILNAAKRHLAGQIRGARFARRHEPCADRRLFAPGLRRTLNLCGRIDQHKIHAMAREDIAEFLGKHAL